MDNKYDGNQQAFIDLLDRYLRDLPDGNGDEITIDRLVDIYVEIIPEIDKSEAKEKISNIIDQCLNLQLERLTPHIEKIKELKEDITNAIDHSTTENEFSQKIQDAVSEIKGEIRDFGEILYSKTSRTTFADFYEKYVGKLNDIVDTAEQIKNGTTDISKDDLSQTVENVFNEIEQGIDDIKEGECNRRESVEDQKDDVESRSQTEEESDSKEPTKEKDEHKSEPHPQSPEAVWDNYKTLFTNLKSYINKEEIDGKPITTGQLAKDFFVASGANVVGYVFVGLAVAAVAIFIRLFDIKEQEKPAVETYEKVANDFVEDIKQNEDIIKIDTDHSHLTEIEDNLKLLTGSVYDSKVDRDERDTDSIDNQETEEKDNQNIAVDETEEKIESDSNDTENKDEGPVEVEESEQESVDQEDSNEQKAIEQDQDDTEIQDENKDVDEPEEEADQVETNEEEPESIETTEIEVQEEPEDSAAEGKIEQASPEEDTSKEDDAVAAMDDSDDDDQKKKDSGAVEDSSSDSQEGEDTQDESDGDSVDIDGHSEEVDPEDEKVDAKEAATGDDKSEREEQTGIEKDEEEKENVESSENNAEQNDTIDNLSEGMQDASLDATNEEAANKTETYSTDNEGNVETATIDSITELQTDTPEEQNISFVDSVLNNIETNGGDINDVIVDEILDRGGDTVDFANDIDELINQGYDIDVDYIADTIFGETTELIEPNITFGFGNDGTIYDVGNSDLGVTPQDISVEAYDNNINDIDLESMIDSTASDFATYTEDTIEAIISDTTLPDVEKPELDDQIDSVDNGLELNQLEKVNASDNLDNAADNASREFDPSDNNQNNNVDIVDSDQYQNNNDVSEPDVDIDYDSIFRE